MDSMTNFNFNKLVLPRCSKNKGNQKMISKRRLRSISVIIFGILFSFVAKGYGEKAIYGLDDRRDLYQVSNPQWLKNARAIAALVPKRKLKKVFGRPDLYRLKTKKAGDTCSLQRFNDQEQIAKCSGFLVAKDILVTAAHCVRTRLGCIGSRWVFGYDISEQGKNYTKIRKKDVYKCVEVIESRLRRFSSLDYAVVRLDRVVKDREPLKIRTTGKVRLGEKLYLGGFPSGLPLKMAGGARVRSNKNENYFLANLDSFEGNSGGPVFAIEGRKLVTDEGTAKIKYIAKITDPQQYDPSLIQALSARLASNIAYAITGSNSVVQTMFAKYEAEVKEARFNDATESATQRLEASDLIESRF